MSETQTVSAGQKMVCAVHPKEETSLRCNKCNRLMCTKCAVRTPVGYRCKQCIRGLQDTFFNAKPIDPILQMAVSIPIALISTALMGLLGLGFFGLLIAFWIGSGAGALIADVAHRLVGKRRGRYGWVAVAAGIVLGGLIGLLFGRNFLPQLLFVGMAVMGAVGRLRLTR